jgi:hypothetical protein
MSHNRAMTNPLALAFGIALAASAPAAAQETAEPLTESERLTLVDQLDALRSEAQSRAENRFESANTAFRNAITSHDAAVELYEKCVEKVDFEDRDRKSSDFRDWRRRNRDRFREEGFGLALRQQLRWLILTMRAAAEPEETHWLAPDALEILNAIYAEAEILADHVNQLAQPVNRTVFARAYDLQGYDIPGWPFAPLTGGEGGIQVDPPFTQLVFPAYRRTNEPEKLREAWNRRIHFEEIARGFWSGEGEDDRGAGQSLARDEFLAETRPRLVWQREIDLFRNGRQRSAALNMLNHLREHLGHRDARAWEQEFRQLVDPGTSTEDEDNGGDKG